MTARPKDDAAELALADTSVFIAVEQERPLSGPTPESIAVSVITIGELRLGVLAAESGPLRAQRLGPCPWQKLSSPAGRCAGRPCLGRLAPRAAGCGKTYADQRLLDRSHCHCQRHAGGFPDGDYDAVPGLRVIRV